MKLLSRKTRAQSWPGLAAAGLWLLLLAAPLRAAPLETLHGQSMGSTWSVKLVAPDPADIPALRAAIQAQLDTVDAQMSTWKPDSDLMRFNRAPAGSWQVLPAAFFQVLAHALALAEATDGAYDPTVGPLVELWGFGANAGPHRVPTTAAIADARARVGWQQVRLDRSQRRAWQPGGVQLDLSSVAKGFAVDQVARYLLAAGVDSFLVEVGGELRAHGRHANGTPWRVAVERPGAADGAAGKAGSLERALALGNAAIATSGDYRHFFEDGRRSYSHHIDPRSGQPVAHRVASVTVVADQCMDADPLGTLLMVLGPDDGMAYARRHHLAVLMLLRTDRGLEERMSPAFADLLP